MRRALALSTTLAILLAAACGSDEKAEPRFLDEASFTPDAATDARADRFVPCDPSDSTCNDASSDASTEAGEAGLCPAPNACNGARALGMASGDSNNDQISASGSTSEWLSVRITEDATFGDLKAKITLVSPTGANFDLHVYYDEFADTVKCTAPASKSSTQQAGISDSVSFLWIDALASDNSRTVSIEVRHVSGTCNPADKWTLLIQGNTS
jgi:hypothetical protein